jgi:hypothetical protein
MGTQILGLMNMQEYLDHPLLKGSFQLMDATAVTTIANLVITFDETVDVESGDIVIYDRK